MSRLASLLLGTAVVSGVAVSLWAQTSSIKDIVLANEKKFSELQIQRKYDDAVPTTRRRTPRHQYRYRHEIRVFVPVQIR